MADFNKTPENEELDLDQLESVSGGALNGAAAVNAFAGTAGVTGAAGVAKECVSDINDLKKRLDRIENKLRITNNN